MKTADICSGWKDCIAKPGVKKSFGREKLGHWEIIQINKDRSQKLEV
jgi:hypothetical protein